MELIIILTFLPKRMRIFKAVSIFRFSSIHKPIRLESSTLQRLTEAQFLLECFGAS